jgi:hypothetical protein
MEQEIQELKAKLLRAEELIQEIQVRGGWGAEGRRAPGTPAPSLFPGFSLETSQAAPCPAWLHRVTAAVKEPVSSAGAPGGAEWRRGCSS